MIFLDVVNAIVLAYFVILNGAYLATSLFAFAGLRRYARRLEAVDVESMITSATAPPITLIAPSFNEEATCVEAVRALQSLVYPDFEILIVNDGSTDTTMTRLTEAFDLVPAARAPTAELPTQKVRGLYRGRRLDRLWVLDKANGGKADALNAGLNYCRTPLFCAVDADSVLERNALTRIVRPFLEDASTIAAGGIIRIVNGCTVSHGIVTDVRLPRRLLPRFQVLEYLRAFLAGRMGWDALGAVLIISGAFGLFRRAMVVEVGGYATDTVGEDLELVVRLHRHCRERGIPYRITFVPDPVAWTECPETLRQLGRQRDRWQRGLIEGLWRHRRMLMNPRYGRIGLLAFPYFFVLEMIGPLIEVFGYLALAATALLGGVSLLHATAFLMVAVLLGGALSFAAVALEELSFRRYPGFRALLHLFALGLIENFGYRQLTVLWRVRGFLSKVLRVKGWGRMERKGFRGPA